jgi:hypothetical protein
MELLLNLAWALLALAIVCLWLRFAPRVGSDWRMQFVALAVLILILLPVISVSDDLQAIQNPAEADSCLRRDHVVTTPHSIHATVANMPQPFYAEPQMSLVQFTSKLDGNAPTVSLPALTSIENRPPPTA